jgi:hypothetical protein
VTDREAGARRSGGPAHSPADLAKQLRDAADRLMSGWTAAGRAVTGAASGPGVPPALPPLPPLPAASSAQQVEAVLDDIAAHRARVQALRTQLDAFDEQLGVLEANLRPVLEWTRAWAHVEKAMSEFWGFGAPAAGEEDRRSTPDDQAE